MELESEVQTDSAASMSAFVVVVCFDANPQPHEWGLALTPHTLSAVMEAARSTWSCYGKGPLMSDQSWTGRTTDAGSVP